MNRTVAIVLGVVFIAAGVACLVARVQFAAQLGGIWSIVVSSLGVVGLLAGVAVIGRRSQNTNRS